MNSTPSRNRWRPPRAAAAALTVLVAAALSAVAPPAGAQTLRQAVPATLEIPDHPRVRYYADQYSSARSRSWLLGVVDRASFFADYILSQLEQRDMPPELLFLPGIESGFFSSATSPVGAAGLWQLMNSTARHYGLINDDLVDERRDFWKATDVALRVLQWNHSQLGSWEMALAAYNAGLGRVSSSVRYGGTSNYWELQRRGLLPRETSEFVPRYFGLLLALRNLPADQWPRLDGLHRWRRVPVPHGGIELSQLGQVAGVPRGVLERANAELRYGLTPVRRGADAYQIKVPAHFYDRLTAVVASGADLIRFHRHTVRTGDTISELAEAFQVSAVLIHEYNDVNPRRLRVGTALHIPLIEGMDPDELGTSAPRDLRAFTAQYQVASGDTLWEIARQHDTTIESLAWANDLHADGTLHPGQVLRVPYRWAPPAISGFV